MKAAVAQYGQVPSSEAMRHFDDLPAALRSAINMADFPFDPCWAAKRIARGHKPERIAKLINLSTQRKIHAG